jgi:hypothetical protein
MKDLRTRRGADPDVDLDGPAGWTRGAGWDDESALHPRAYDVNQTDRSARPR